jgi:hypothetical protein
VEDCSEELILVVVKSAFTFGREEKVAIPDV